MKYIYLFLAIAAEILATTFLKKSEVVPCCKFCNSSLKGSKEFMIEDPNPYEVSFDDLFSFAITGIPEESIDIHVKKKNDSVNRYLSIFRIEELYKYHINHAEELIRKKILYPDSYIKELCERNNELFANNKIYLMNEEAMKAFLMGYAVKSENINDEVLGKLRVDIANQLNGNDESPSEELIKELRKFAGKKAMSDKTTSK